MTPRDDDLRADLRALAHRGTGTDLNPTRLVVDPRADRWWGEYLRQLDERWRARIIVLLDAHEPDSEPEAPRIEDVVGAHRPLLADPGFVRCGCSVGDNHLSPMGWWQWNAHVAQAIREAGAR